MTQTDQVLHDITMLYLENQDLSSLTPAQVLDEYRKVYDAICKHHNDNPDYASVGLTCGCIFYT